MILASLGSTPSARAQSDPAFNRAPLSSVPYAQLPLGAIRPEGWLREQLVRMANGMTGHLDEWYPTVGSSNGWVGGDGDVWERGPYWLDGLVPLAFLLDDETLIAKARPYVEWTLASQDESGYFGPRPEPEGTEDNSQQQRVNAADWWPRMVMLKVLQQWHDATGDPRVIELMTRYFRYQLDHLDETPLGHWTGWGAARGGENQASVHWLYNRTGAPFLLDLSQKLFEQTLDWTGDFENRADAEDYWRTHIVNVAMGIKQPAQEYVRTGDERYLRAVKSGLAALMEKHGQAVGMFSGDEPLHGTDPVQGIELCAVVEFMLSLESLATITGDVAWADRLERIAYNALPTQVTDDQTGRQYFQQVNQIRLSAGDHGIFFEGYEDATCFGLLNGYPCCTANLHQGWPKLTQNTWLRTADGGLGALVYAPTSVRTTIGGKAVEIMERTSWPMEDTVRFHVTEADAARFPLHLRIPTWAVGARLTVNGEIVRGLEAGTVAVVDRTWQSGDEVVLFIPAEIEISRWHENGIAVHRGPLQFALPIDAVVRPARAKNPGMNSPEILEAHPTGEWNYGLTVDEDHPLRGFEIVRDPSPDDWPWTEAGAPIRLRITGYPIPSWGEYNGSAGPQPPSPVRARTGRPKTVELIPYGSTMLRIALFPEVLPR